ncbi:hypothetical protein [Amycolatopsis sp. WQ 127309]|uniref:hypothetical protein n=1 Tax=Amycolatopsis sp. WQ 127309 TaxID=2932773 RepID=UPI001FF1334B|nr:hypothetical protein [Amycolatopsis sp. WQ 127309]UOZ06369.1 hypothetical protein MUY22_47520 [Amycolatopsis sp. WQ 127309]
MATLSRLAAFAAVLAIVAGCSAAPAATSDFGAGDLAVALGKVPRDLSTVHGLDLPLDRSQLTPVEELEVIKARNTLVERCLAAHGLSFTFPPVDPVRDAAKPRRHGLVDAAEAAAYGYRDPAVFAPHGADRPPPPPDVVAMITGTREGRDVPPGGCAGEADRALAPDGKPGQEPVGFALSQRSYDITRTTPPVTAAAAAWSRCMAEAGFRYAEPQAAIEDPAFGAGRASAREIAVAVRDVRCKERTGWVRTWVALERAVQEGLVSHHAADLAREQRHKDSQLAVARGIAG